MGTYVLRRLLLLIPVLWGITAVVFLLIHSAPGDPITSFLGVHPSVEQVAKLRHLLGLDEPLPVQYVLWLSRVVHGDLGTSLLTHQSVADTILQRLPTTLALTLSSMILSALIGIPLGIASAMRRDGVLDNVGRTVAMVGISVPPFLAGLVLIIVFAVQFRLFPPGGSIAQYGPAALVLPSIALAIEFAAVIVRFTRASMLDVLDQDYVRTARAKGLSPRRVEYDHAFRNAFLPILTVIGLRTGVLLSGALVTENIFGLPGLGTLLTEAIGLRDYPLILGSVLVTALLFVFVNLVVDLVYVAVDPRVRYST
jgi:peptide/nickel transport system permease protein